MSPSAQALCELRLELGPSLSSLLLQALQVPGSRPRRGTRAHLGRRGSELVMRLEADRLAKLRALIRAYSSLIRSVLEVIAVTG
jgi:tRNA threonylcarbamoyladenosine modification (KEOPS) complex  Pcc1 subunit